MEDAFSKAQEIITERIGILEAQCNALVEATAAENRSLKKQLQECDCSCVELETRTQSIEAAKTLVESGLTSCPGRRFLPETPRELERQLHSVPAWRLSPRRPSHQPAGDLPTESLETREIHQVSTSNGSEIVHSNNTSPRDKLGDASVVAGPRESSVNGARRSILSQGRKSVRSSTASSVSFCFENTPSMRTDDTVKRMEFSKGAKRSARRFHQYDVRLIWQDRELDGLGLLDLVQGEILERVGTTGAASISSRSTSRRSSRFVSMVARGRAPTVNQHWFILHPDSLFRSLWIAACVVLLVYDIIMVPVYISFEPPETRFSKTMVLTAIIFWTVDIPLNFITGVRTIDGVEVRFKRIASVYAKSWLIFDILLVLPEWVTMAIGNRFRSHSVLRMARWGRLMRLLRLARVMKPENLRPVMRQIAYQYHLSHVYVVVTQGWLGTSSVLVVSLHFMSCFWFLFGKTFDNGWVEANGLSDADAGTSYVVSTRWTICRLQGLFSNYTPTSNTDMVMDIFLILGTFILASHYISKMTAVTMTRVTDKCPSIWEKGIAFVQRHGLSRELIFRLEKAMESTHYAGALEIASDEATLLEALPASLQQDLIYEARKEVVLKNTFFSNLLSFNKRAPRHICNDAMSPLIVVEEEVLFTYDDACHRMLFINTGRLKYALSFDHAYGFADVLEKGCFISEPVLWTTWEHKGNLKSVQESVLLALDAHKFGDVILQHKGPNMVAVRYAKHYVWRMNQETVLNDMAAFPDLSLEELDNDLFVGSDEDHFMFISHYKVEAGTEATLMRDILVPMLAEDRSNQANNFMSPIFIDSEDLSDLSRLKAHVLGSASLVLLLTPGLLSRPWCLIEIVTALENDKNIVPVEVQRPGSSYHYPDEAFYAGLREGRLLSQNAVELLATEGIYLPQVEAAVRKVFMKIACPFSPHKSKAIREAELDAIYKRCHGTRGGLTFSSEASAGCTRSKSSRS